MNIIDVRDLKRTFHLGEVVVPVLRGITIAIEKGEFVSLMGPSGSGKSTMLHILGFLDTQTDGEYLFDGKSINDYSEPERAHVRSKRMGFVFQTFNLLPRTTVLENVKLPLLYSDVPEAKWDELARSAIHSVGLEHREDYESSRLSGGERQRVAIARALVNDPDVIFADEPTGNLDSKSGEQVMKVIESLHVLGHTIVLVTHETYTAEYAHRIIRLRDGIVESDDAIQKPHSHGLRK